MNRRQLFELFKLSFRDWLTDNAPLRAAALTFFIILPLPSLLLVIQAFFAQFYGQTQATQLVTEQITAIAGPAVAGLFSELLTTASSPFSSLWSSITVVGFSLIGAIGTFAVLRDAMDIIWEVKRQKKPKLITRIKMWIGPFILVSLLGLIVIVWTVTATTLFTAIKLFLINRTLTFVAVTAVQVLLSVALSTVLFGIIYRTIPQARIHWVDVNLAAIVTSIAFTVANYIFGTYIQTFTITTVIGSAGALLIILLWIFILNQIILFGAELSKVYTVTLGPHIREHLPPFAEKIYERLKRAGDTLERATKGDIFEESEKAEAQKDKVKSD